MCCSVGEEVVGGLCWWFSVGFVVDDVVCVWGDDEVVDEAADGAGVQAEFDVVLVVGVLDVKVSVEFIEVRDGGVGGSFDGIVR